MNIPLSPTFLDPTALRFAFIKREFQEKFQDEEIHLLSSIKAQPEDINIEERKTSFVKVVQKGPPPILMEIPIIPQKPPEMQDSSHLTPVELRKMVLLNLLIEKEEYFANSFNNSLAYKTCTEDVVMNDDESGHLSNTNCLCSYVNRDVDPVEFAIGPASIIKDMIGVIKKRGPGVLGAFKNYAQLIKMENGCEFGCVNGIVKLVYKEKVSVNNVLRNCLSPLQCACIFGQYGVVALLLDLGATVDYIREGDNFTVMMALASYSTGEESDTMLECAKALMKAGGKLNISQSTSGSTALLLAVKRGFVRLAEFLLDNGEDIEHIDKEGHKAIYYAQWNENMTALLKRYLWVEVAVAELSDYEKIIRCRVEEI